MYRFSLAIFAVLLCAALSAWPQSDQPTAPTAVDSVNWPAHDTADRRADAHNERLASSELLSTTVLPDRVSYRAHVNRTTIQDRRESTPDFEIVSFSYEADGPSLDRQRPVFFFFNGGPGSSTIWLHLTGFGPEKISLELVDPPEERRALSQYPNPGFLIDIGDLVFVDPIGTGLSRPLGDTSKTVFQDIRADAQALCRFAEAWLAANERTDAPVYLVGSSYGSLRVAGIASHTVCRDLQKQVRGLVLISGLLDLPARASGSTLQMMGAFPTWAAVAWHHRRVNRATWGYNIGAYIAAAKTTALEEIAPTWIDDLSGVNSGADERQRGLIGFLGLSDIVQPGVTMQAGYKAMVSSIRANKRSCSYDARFNCRPGEYLPSIKLIPFANELEDYLADYLKASLDYDLDRDAYIAFRGPAFSANWDFRFLKSSERGHGTNMAEVLVRANRRASSQFRRQGGDAQGRRIMVASGAYDIMTPFYAMELALRRAKYPNDDLTIKTYNGGHIMYLDPSVGRQLADDIRAFVRAGVRPSQ